MHSVSQIVKKNPSITYCTDATLCGWGAFQDTFSKGVGGGGGGGGVRDFNSRLPNQ